MGWDIRTDPSLLRVVSTEIIGLDLVPIQPRSVPPNCRFEVYDINDGLPFPDKTFDVVHMRFVHSGVSLVGGRDRETGRVDEGTDDRRLRLISAGDLDDPPDERGPPRAPTGGPSLLTLLPLFPPERPPSIPLTERSVSQRPSQDDPRSRARLAKGHQGNLRPCAPDQTREAGCGGSRPSRPSVYRSRGIGQRGL